VSGDAAFMNARTYGLRGLRTIVPSPFAREKDSVFYFGGFDETGVSGGSDVFGNWGWIFKGSLRSRVTAVARQTPAVSSPAGRARLRIVAGQYGPMVRISASSSGARLIITDAGGRTVRTLTVRGGERAIDLSALPCGVYVARSGPAAVRFVKPR